MNALYHILLPGLFCLVPFTRLHAQDPALLPAGRDVVSPSVQLLTVENGLPQGYVNGIVQDSAGFIWLGTRDGLARYDGYAVKTFRYDPADSTTIASDVIQTLYLDRKNQIWILYENGAVDIFNPVNGKVKHIHANDPLGWLTKDRVEYPFVLQQDSHERYWFVSSKLDQLRYFTRSHPKPVNIPIPDGELIIALKEDKQGIMHVCTDHSFYTIRNNRFHKIADLPYRPEYSHARISQMVQDKQGSWIIRNNECIEILKPNGKWKVVKIKDPPIPTFIYFVCKSRDGGIYINSAGRIFRLNPDYSLSLVWTNPNNPEGVPSMMVDRSNVLWIGLNTFGARMINLTSSGFHSYPYKNGFIMDVLTRLFHIPYPEKYRQLVDSYLQRYAYDAAGKLWLVGTPLLSQVTPTQKKQLRLFQVADKKYIPAFFNFYSPGWLQITFDQNNQCWGIILNRDKIHGILVKADLATGVITPIQPLHREYYEIGYLTSFQNKLCIVYQDEIQLYDPVTGKSVHYKSKDHFGNVKLLMAVPDPDHAAVLWITSLGYGLIRFNTVNGEVQAFTVKNGIPSNSVYAAVFDKEGYLWCSSNKGIFRFDPVSHKVLSFVKKDGLQGNEFNRYHFLKTPDGHIVFGGTGGWTVFHPDSVHIDTYQPPAVITNILVNNKPLVKLPEWKSSVVTGLHTLRLNYDQNFVTFTFAGLEFSNPDKLQYRYQLQGFDKDWVNVGTQHIANYTNLPAGKYIFKVNASNEARIWSHKIKTLKLIILPPWWKTWWAYVIYTLLICAVIYSLYRYRINRLRLQHQVILQQKEAEQLREMDEMKSRFFSNITHEFRTPLSLIVAPLEQINKEKKIRPALKKKLSGVQRNVHQLLRLINQLLDMSKMEAGNMKIALSRGNLALFIQNIIKNFEAQASVKNIELHFVSPLKEEYNFDADKWQKTVSNLLSNAIKFTPEGGHIHVQLTLRQACQPKGSPAHRQAQGSAHNRQQTTLNRQPSTANILLKVQDSGIGIPKNKLPHIFSRFYQVDDSLTKSYSGTGIGLALTKELVELMGGTIEVKSPPASEALLDGGQASAGRPDGQTSKQGKGTLFCITIPVEKAINTDVPLLKKIEPLPGSYLPETKEMDTQGINEDKDISSVLVVEDNAKLNEFIADTLKNNYRVMMACNGKEAWKMAVEELPDLILSDIMMPEMDGYTLCEKIKRSADTNHIAIILLSAKASHESVIEGLEHLADDYIAKPFHPDELLLRIHNLLDRQQKLRDYFKDQLTHTDGKIDTATIKNPFLSTLYEVIEAHLDEKSLNVELLAQKMNIHRRTLNRKLEMIAGLSANKVIRQYRLKKAAELLRSGHNVSEAAYNTGFETLSYFSISFKQSYGVSPSEYVIKNNKPYE